jgi:hypothetical protein
MPQVAAPVDSVSWAFVKLSPRLVGGIGNFVISLNPLLVVDEPVVEELFLGFLQVVQISVTSNISRTLSVKKGETYLG